MLLCQCGVLRNTISFPNERIISQGCFAHQQSGRCTSARYQVKSDASLAHITNGSERLSKYIHTHTHAICPPNKEQQSKDPVPMKNEGLAFLLSGRSWKATASIPLCSQNSFVLINDRSGRVPEVLLQQMINW